MNTSGKTTNKASKSKITASTLMRLAGISAMVAGLCFLVIGAFHPVNESSFVASAAWVNAHIAATALGFFGLFGMAGLYVRQVEESGWLGLAGFLLFTVWMTLVSGFSLVEAFVLPKLMTESPAFVAGFLGMFTGVPSTVELGVLPTIWNLSGPMFILGPALFGMATFRARVLPRWAGALLALNIVLAPLGGMAPPELQPKIVMIPVGLALAWMGYALFSERRANVVEAVPARSARAEPSKVA
jgi:hypothetical protein